MEVGTAIAGSGPGAGPPSDGIVAVSLCHAAGPTAGAVFVVEAAIPTNFVEAVEVLLQLPAAAGACDLEAGVDLYALVAEEGSEGDASLQRLGDDSAVTEFIVNHAHNTGSLMLYFTCTDDVSTPLPDHVGVEGGSEGTWTGTAAGGSEAHGHGHDETADADDSPSGGSPVLGTPVGSADVASHPPPLPRMDLVAGRRERRLQYQRGPVLLDTGATQLQLCVSMLTAQLLMMRQVMRLRGETDAGWRERLMGVEREYKLLRQLRHPGIIRCLARDSKRAGQYGILLEYLPGGTLRQLVLRFGPLPESSARRFVRQVAVALADCHARGVVHGAVSTDHVLLTGDGAAKLAGWTDAFACGNRTAGPAAGWHELASSRKVDAWFLGLLAYELTTGVVCHWARVMPCLDQWVWLVTSAAERNAATLPSQHPAGRESAKTATTVSSAPLTTHSHPESRISVMNPSPAAASVDAHGPPSPSPSPPLTRSLHPTSPVLLRGFTAGELAAYVPSPTVAPTHVATAALAPGSGAGVPAAAAPSPRHGDPFAASDLPPPRELPSRSSASTQRQWWSMFASWKWERPKPNTTSTSTSSTSQPTLTRTPSPSKRGATGASSLLQTAVAASSSLPSHSSSSSSLPTATAGMSATPASGSRDDEWGPADADMADANPTVRRLRPSPDHCFPPAYMVKPGFLDTVTHAALPRLLDDLAACLPALPPLPADASPQLRAFVNDCTRLHASERPGLPDLLQHHPFLQPDDLDAAVATATGAADGPSLCGFDGLRKVLSSAAAIARAGDGEHLGEPNPAGAPPVDSGGGITSLGGPQFRLVASPTAAPPPGSSSSRGGMSVDGAGRRLQPGFPRGAAHRHPHTRVTPGSQSRGRDRSSSDGRPGREADGEESTDYTVASDSSGASHLLTTSGGTLVRRAAADSETSSTSNGMNRPARAVRLSSQGSTTSDGSGSGSGSGAIPLSITSPALRARVGGTGEVITLPRGLGYEQLMGRADRSRAGGRAGPASAGASRAMAPGGGGGGRGLDDRMYESSWARVSGIAPSMRGSPVDDGVRTGSSNWTGSDGVPGNYASLARGAGVSAAFSATLSPASVTAGGLMRPHFFPAASVGSDVAVAADPSGAPGHAAVSGTPAGVAAARAMWRGATLRQSSVMSMGPDPTVEPPSMALVDGGVVQDAYRLHDPLLQANALVGDREAQRRKAEREALGRDAAGRTLQQTRFMAAAAAGVIGPAGVGGTGGAVGGNSTGTAAYAVGGASDWVPAVGTSARVPSTATMSHARPIGTHGSSGVGTGIGSVGVSAAGSRSVK